MSTEAPQMIHNGVVEVSDLPTTRVEDYAGELDDVYFERKGGKTFLISAQQ